MAKEFQRAERVADYLQRELALLIAREMRDPRLGLVDVTGVEVSKDISHARVFVTFPGESSRQRDDERVDVLNGAAGYIRSQLAKVSTMRTTPRLKFIFDESIQRGRYLSQLIDDVVADDRRRAEQAGEPGQDDRDPPGSADQ